MYEILNIVLIIIPFLLVPIALIFRNVDYIKISVSEMAFTTFFSWGLAYDNYKNMEKYMKERETTSICSLPHFSFQYTLQFILSSVIQNIVEEHLRVTITLQNGIQYSRLYLGYSIG